ncbi:aspartate/glutamate racemase family protein [Archaeoglobus profundus]|uniref:Aspartate racemase n=1 Tax=Archaeoglobus profundus (strain DSM 5631 / JCM 9629 / NBRC 100127 / Av18) TaxID=572546 RepID=D2RG16_ARCPA|nr:aspartate/glutamate racemase family protein [Archaeoglobus profundus]ADB57241.1 aspartate racemase [Archaeoglobus profundus DSM 5631]
MKTIGLLGGMSWESTLEYYKIINEEVAKRLNGLHSAKIILYSFDFSEIAELQSQNRWNELGEILAEKAKILENAGADFILICTNTMHKVADYVQSRINVPLLSIIDCVAREVVKRGIKRVGLLGTKFTMEDGFYEDGLRKYGLEVVIPDEEDRNEVHRIIFEELCRGIFKDSSKRKLIEIIERLKMKGAEGVILGCTELPLLVKHAEIPIFDSTKIHAVYAVEFALK